MVTYFIAGIEFPFELSSANAVILYSAPGTAALIIMLFLKNFIAFTYSPIIGTPKRNTSYPEINGCVVTAPSPLFTSYITLDLVGAVTRSVGTGTWDPKGNREKIKLRDVVLNHFVNLIIYNLSYLTMDTGIQVFKFNKKAYQYCSG